MTTPAQDANRRRLADRYEALVKQGVPHAAALKQATEEVLTHEKRMSEFDKVTGNRAESERLEAKRLRMKDAITIPGWKPNP